jgi:hypothetical protein
MAAPAITAAAPLQPTGRIRGVGKEACRIPDSMGRGPPRHKRHGCGSPGSASRPTPKAGLVELEVQPASDPTEPQG